MKSSCGSCTSSSCSTVRPPTPESNTPIGRSRPRPPSSLAGPRCTRAIIPERYGRRNVRALVVSNMLPDAAHPERGRFVRDQVAALRGLPGLDVELYEFPPGGRALARAVSDLRRRFAARAGASRRFDVVHAHFGLTAWPAFAVPAHVRALTLHGTDLRHPRTRLATRAALPRIDLLAVVSAP